MKFLFSRLFLVFACLMTSASMTSAALAVIKIQSLIDGGAPRLSSEDAHSLLPVGATIETIAVSTGNTRDWVNAADGTFVATSHGAGGVSTGTGKWRISNDGLYCVEILWKKSEENWCRAIYRFDEAYYLAPKNLANNADKSYGQLRVVPNAGVVPSTALTANAIDSSTVLSPGQARDVKMIYMGGNDCPPCVSWRGLELPKLEKMKIYMDFEFIHVVKTVVSPVPSSMFLPDKVKPLKTALDEAGAGNRGSSQTAIVVDGKIFDYYFGYRSAQEIEERIRAIKDGGTYPFERCVKLVKGNAAQCAVKG
ncbi:DUF995 domain-containing protein [Variovorax sp. RHLX14]|uniref:DUF995 domain-containing protein n=1 Tax=Variovorax sp. RHLX14 TaxID=1259731 RepID=UPI003F44C994